MASFIEWLKTTLRNKILIAQDKTHSHTRSLEKTMPANWGEFFGLPPFDPYPESAAKSSPKEEVYERYRKRLIDELIPQNKVPEVSNKIRQDKTSSLAQVISTSIKLSPQNLVTLEPILEETLPEHIKPIEWNFFRNPDKNDASLILDGVTMKPRALDEVSNPLHIIYFCRNGEQYENCLSEMSRDALQYNAKVIGFNYRNVGKSVGNVTDINKDYLADGLFVVNSLLREGVPAERIILKGHSLGSMVAAQVAQKLHHPEPVANVEPEAKKVFLWSDRGPSSFTSFIVNYLGWFGKLVRPLIKLVLTATNSEIDAAAAYNSIPATHKAFFTAKNDEVIDYETSIGYQQKQQLKKDKPLLAAVNRDLPKVISIIEARKAAAIQAGKPEAEIKNTYDKVLASLKKGKDQLTQDVELTEDLVANNIMRVKPGTKVKISKGVETRECLLPHRLTDYSKIMPEIKKPVNGWGNLFNFFGHKPKPAKAEQSAEQLFTKFVDRVNHPTPTI